LSRDDFGVQLVAALYEFGDGHDVVRKHSVLVKSQHLQPESDQQPHSVVQTSAEAAEEAQGVPASGLQQAQSVRQEIALVGNEIVQQHFRFVLDALQQLGEAGERVEQRPGGRHGVHDVQRARQTLDGGVVPIAHQSDRPPAERDVGRIQHAGLDV